MKRILRAFLFLVLLTAVAGGVALYIGYSRLHEEYKSYAEPEVFVDIPQGAGPASMGQRLVEAGVVRDATRWAPSSLPVSSRSSVSSATVRVGSSVMTRGTRAPRR